MGHYACDMRPEWFDDYNKENKQMNKKTLTNVTNNTTVASRRWAAMRKSTGRLVRSFNTREGARTFKRTHRGIQIFDTINAVAVR